MSGIGLVALVVNNYDVALRFYVDVVGFDLIEDTDQGEGRRWVVVGPPEGRGAALLLARADTEAQRARVGDQTGVRVFGFLETGDFSSDHRRMREAGVTFLEEPRKESYGTVAVFEDLYGNRWDLIQPAH